MPTVHIVLYGVFIGLCMPLGLFLWLRHRGTRLVLWQALIVMALGLTALQILLEETAPPLPAGGLGADFGLQLLWLVISALNVFTNTFFYYAILTVALIYNGLWQRRWGALLTLPMLLTFIFGADLARNELNYPLVALWGSVYWLAAAGLFLAAVFKERSGGRPVGMISAGAMGWALLLPAAGLLLHQSQFAPSMLIYVHLACLLSLMIFLFLYVRGIVLGNRKILLHQARQLESAFLQHAVKNSIAKIKLHALNIRHGLAARQYEGAQRHVDRLLATSDHLMSAANSITRSGGEGLTVQPDWHDLQQVLDGVIAQLSWSRVRLERRDAPCRLYFDADLIKECLANIFNNSVEAVEGAGTIWVDLTETRRHVTLSVRDDGKGMNPWQLAHVFEPFFSSKEAQGHYGLGLAYVRSVMLAHNGRVHVASEPGGGTEVKLTFNKGTDPIPWWAEK